MGVCWYKEEQWDRLREIVADPEKIAKAITDAKLPLEVPSGKVLSVVINQKNQPPIITAVNP